MTWKDRVLLLMLMLMIVLCNPVPFQAYSPGLSLAAVVRGQGNGRDLADMLAQAFERLRAEGRVDTRRTLATL
jgi:hypothetical protein